MQPLIQQRPILYGCDCPWCAFSALMLRRILWLLMWWDDATKPHSPKSLQIPSDLTLPSLTSSHVPFSPKAKTNTPPNTMGHPQHWWWKMAFLPNVFWNQIKHMGICIKSLSLSPTFPTIPTMPNIPNIFTVPLYSRGCCTWSVARTFSPLPQPMALPALLQCSGIRKACTASGEWFIPWESMGICLQGLILWL